MPCANFARMSAVAGATSMRSSPFVSAMCWMSAPRDRSHWSVITSCPLNVCSVRGVMNCRPPAVMMTCTSVPAFTRPRTISAALYAAMPPLTPRAMRGRPAPRSTSRRPVKALRGLSPEAPLFLRAPRPPDASASRLMFVQDRSVPRIGLGGHLGDLLDRVLLRERAVAVGDHAGDDLLHRDRDRLEGVGLDARPGPPLQLAAALPCAADELELVADRSGRNHRTSLDGSVWYESLF